MIVKKRYIDCKESEGLIANIIRHLQKDNRKITAVVGIVRGGLTPAVMLSHYYDCPLYILDYSLRDRNDAQEFTANDGQVLSKAMLTTEKGGHVLVVDDINDSGDTLTAIKNFITDERMALDNWLYATMLEKCTSRFDCDYYGELLMDEKCNDWIVFPWEDWWTNKG
jgi:hypoxanthine phosphoribosyltransferase